ncbi:RDD family protein [Pseudomonas nicosulfuronedens]|uniref:RDD family protein n=1 Tax=Pseudomonas nicosulfuronedens TaxID=2571105 RepID=A0A5R9QMF5_9PSED|nr:RDD family protein [Pseudomonas nicosulfuronedens]MDH1009937.1 RDD family protein [Pseudomonas nicosulfuronedens]MDH1978913.1 RDD family protein [Pseudomonas nicosulfuronedens]MDH2028408.1 RDD family protein [Pseudomonas nicosulfuronedens]TLX70776.1 RDD family protein [Pseudomonas nicosulfuronedens]
MPKPQQLQPVGDFPPATLLRRFAAMFYDFLLCVALLMVVTLVYQQGFLRLIYGSEKLRMLADQGALTGDPLLSSLLFISVFAFFAKFWTHSGQTLGMQVWGVRVQNANGTRISLMQALLRFVIAIASWGCAGLGFLWMLWDKDKRTWQDRYSESVVIQIPKAVRKATQGRG